MKDFNFRKVSLLFSEPKKVVITSHHNPDGDAIGSAMAMYHVLMQLQHEVHVILPNRFPDFLGWISDSDRAMVFENDEETCKKILNGGDIIFCLDYNAPKRVGQMEDALKAANGIKIMIDHHPDPDEEAFQYVLSSVQVSSTAELIYVFLYETGHSKWINQAAAESLYTGIVTDTGSFSYACNSADMYRIIADLIERGVDAEKLHRLIYDNFSESRIRLLGYAINQKLQVFKEYHTAFITLSREELERFNYTVGDTEGIVNYPLSIKGINMSILLTEREKKIRLSFRSKGEFEVNEIAREHFEGGGHQNAAGGDSFADMEKTVQKIRDILPLYKQKLDF